MASPKRVDQKSGAARSSLAHLEIDWSPFLGRPLFVPRGLDCENILEGKAVLVTGAGGSIGSALAERLMGGLSGTLLLLDRSQLNLRKLHARCAQRHVTLPTVKFIHADILHESGLQKVFAEYRPAIVFHAAAMKHLPPLESDPFTAIEDNVLGALRILELVDCCDVEYFVNVSSDKAVNATSVLGVSKRITELMLLATQSIKTRRISLRLGNVLGSSGSVVPVFLRSLEDGLPLRITDPRASRYFLALNEAAAFLIQALVASDSLLLPEMGRPRTIMELANFLWREWDRRDGVPLKIFTGLRDGEKLSEQLTHDYEYLEQSRVRHLYRICGPTAEHPDQFAEDLGQLLDLVMDRRKRGLIDALLRLVPEFTPSQSLLRYVH